ncbi:hypothetical protein LJC26_03445 [Desulfovibrio sp. OttesenSCG-928-O18]|nr:hypothetical protein [Desulfovibrio sp. OttesenSCG-928-O18]
MMHTTQNADPEIDGTEKLNALLELKKSYGTLACNHIFPVASMAKGEGNQTLVLRGAILNRRTTIPSQTPGIRMHKP